MLTTLLVAIALAPAPQTFDLIPTDDIWVYEHATDGAKDTAIRIWGAEGKSVPPDPIENGEFSYGYLKWDLSSIPKDAGKPTEAKLILTQLADPGYTADYAKDNPIEVRPLSTDFSEKDWGYEKAGKIYPPKEASSVFGSGYPAKWDSGKEVRIEIDLLKGPGEFSNYLRSTLRSDKRQLGAALASSANPGEMGQKVVYKVYSKDCDKKEFRPVLHLVFG